MKKTFLILLPLLSFFSGCGGGSDSTQTLQSEITQLRYQPTLQDIWQYQLTSDLNLSTNATLYDIDLEETSQETIADLHAKGLHVICYMSAGSAENWRNDFSDFDEKDLGNTLSEWEGEVWLDIRSLRVHNIMSQRLERAKLKGCDGIEADNVDGYMHDTGFDLDAEDQLNYNLFLAKEAHTRGLSIGLKNDLLQVQQLVNDFDFAINEQCFFNNECSYLDPFIAQDKPVFNVEYNAKYFEFDSMTQLCNQAKSHHYSTTILPRALDGSFGYNCSDYLFHKKGVGFGGADAFKFHDNEYINVYNLINKEYTPYKNSVTDFNETKFNLLSDYLQKSKYVVFWLTELWQENWFDLPTIQLLMDQGKIPVFLYWYFGDHLQESGYLQNNEAAYLEDAQRVSDFIGKLHGDKFLILEPEFNKNNILDDEAQTFIDVMQHAIAIFKNGNNDIFLSLAMMDTGSRTALDDLSKCGYDSCALGDIYEWKRVDPIYKALIKELDFISFEEMVAQFSRDPQDPGTWDDPNPKSYTDDEIGINYLATRIENFALYLQQTYHKPVFMPYIAIATATWNDENNNSIIDTNEINTTGWEEEASDVYKELQSNQLFGYGVMELFDNPSHDDGGYQFFMENEYHLGIIKAPVRDKQLTGAIEFKSDIISTLFK